MSNNHERKILHVDDDPSILRIVASVLSKRGYTVVSVSDPSQAIPSLIQTSTRLVILDIDMPEKSGLSLLEDIKAVDGSIQVIMLTGMVSMATIFRATQLKLAMPQIELTRKCYGGGGLFANGNFETGFLPASRSFLG